MCSCRHFQVYTDVRGGFREELHEITLSAGIEYTLKNRFSFRSGGFYEHEITMFSKTQAGMNNFPHGPDINRGDTIRAI